MLLTIEFHSSFGNDDLGRTAAPAKRAQGGVSQQEARGAL